MVVITALFAEELSSSKVWSLCWFGLMIKKYTMQKTIANTIRVIKAMIPTNKGLFVCHNKSIFVVKEAWALTDYI